MLHRLLSPIFVLCALLVLASSCFSSRNPRKGTPATPGELKALLSQARDPRSLFITVYKSKEGPIFADANRPHHGQRAEYDLVKVGEYFAPVFYSTDDKKQRFPFLLDIRSQRSWVDYPTALEMRVKPVGPDPYAAYADHLPEAAEGFIGVTETLDISRNLILSSAILNVYPMIENLGPLVRGWIKPEPRMIFGLETLKAFKTVQMDFPAGKVRFWVDGGYKPDPDRVLASLPARVTSKGVTVDGILDGYMGPVYFDPAGKFPLALPAPARDTMDQVTLGNFVIRNIPVEDSDTLGLGSGGLPSVGYELLKDLIITIDNGQGRIFLELPPPANG